MDTCSGDGISIPCERGAIAIDDELQKQDRATKPEADPITLSSPVVDPAKTASTTVQGSGAGRSLSTSWALQPQCMRGITLGELKAFCAERYDWLAQLRWRCAACGRGCERADCECTSVMPHGHEACIHCGNPEGSLSMRNLYEVMNEMIKPRCAQHKVSYVELLSLNPDRPPMRVQTFVSHWWGEEFLKFVATLEHFAASRGDKFESGKRVVMRCMLMFFCLTLLFSILVATLVPFDVDKDDLTGHTGDTPSYLYANRVWFHLCGASSVGVIALFVAYCLRLRRIAEVRGQAARQNHTFWICAFANNQYAIDHALGRGGDVTQSSFAQALRSETCTNVVAVLDHTLNLYRRIWCAFELFFVAKALPRDNIHHEICLGNEHGVISDGNATASTIIKVRDLLNSIDTEKAEASVQRNKIMVKEYIEHAGTSYAELDECLRHLAQQGVDAQQRRKHAPAALMFLGPLAGGLYANSFSYAIHSVLFTFDILNPPTKGDWEGLSHHQVENDFRRLSVVTLLGGILSTIFLWIYAFGRRSLRCKLHIMQRRASQRFRELIIFSTLSTMIAWLIRIALEIYYLHGHGPPWFLILGLALMGVNNASFICLQVTGIVFGIFYSCFRNAFWFERIRRSVENALFD